MWFLADKLYHHEFMLTTNILDNGVHMPISGNIDTHFLFFQVIEGHCNDKIEREHWTNLSFTFYNTETIEILVYMLTRLQKIIIITSSLSHKCLIGLFGIRFFYIIIFAQHFSKKKVNAHFFSSYRAKWGC